MALARLNGRSRLVGKDGEASATEQPKGQQLGRLEEDDLWTEIEQRNVVKLDRSFQWLFLACSTSAMQITVLFLSPDHNHPDRFLPAQLQCSYFHPGVSYRLQLVRPSEMSTSPRHSLALLLPRSGRGCTSPGFWVKAAQLVLQQSDRQ